MHLVKYASWQLQHSNNCLQPLMQHNISFKTILTNIFSLYGNWGKIGTVLK